MRSRPFRRSLVVLFPTLAFAVVALSSGQQAKPAASGGSAGSTTGTTGSTSGTTGSTSGGSTGGGASAGWQLTGSTDGTTSRSSGSSNGWTPANYGTSTDIGNKDAITSTGPGSWSATSSGNATLSLKWVGGGTAPAYGWVLVTTTAHWDSSSGSGSDSPAFTDKTVGDAHGETKSGRRVFRIDNGGSKSWSLSASYTLSLANGAMGTATENCSLHGEMTDKTASLSRVDGGVKPSLGNDYYADTLYSWDDSDGVKPGPNDQQLIGTYGGTWSKLSDGATDNVILNWTGAVPAGGSTIGPMAGQDHHTNIYPAFGAVGRMPLAGTSSTQDWTYTVSDGVDTTSLTLTCHWRLH